jgi:hypothetical protein
MEIRPIVASDREPLAELLRRIETFSKDEVACALELIDAARSRPDHPDYRGWSLPSGFYQPGDDLVILAKRL